LDAEKEAYFNNKLYARALVRERGFQFEETESEPEVARFKAVIQRRQWGRFVANRRNAPKDLVREFYANTLVEDTDIQPSELSYLSYYRGYPIDYSPARVRAHLGLLSPEEEKAIFRRCRFPSFSELRHHYAPSIVAGTICQPGRSWTKSMIPKDHLLPEAVVWAHFVLDSLFPNSNKSEIRVDAALLIYCLMADIPIDVAQVISYKIYSTLNLDKSGKSLPYPGLVTELVKAQVPPPIFAEAGREVEEPNPLIDEDEIRRKLGEVAASSTEPARRRPGRRPAQRPAPTPVPQATEVAPPWVGRILHRQVDLHHDLGLIWEALGTPQEEEWRGPRPLDDLERQWMGLNLDGAGSSRGADMGPDDPMAD
jgi:hypothetical protein